MINDLLDIRNCHDLCLTHDYKLIAIKGDFSVTQTCICVNAPCNNMYIPSTVNGFEFLHDGYCPGYNKVTQSDITTPEQCYQSCSSSDYFTLKTTPDGYSRHDTDRWCTNGRWGPTTASSVQQAYEICRDRGDKAFLVFKL